MAAVVLTNVEVKSNPAKFTDSFVFDITFEVIAPGIKEELEWKLIYVGSADNSKCDQELDSVFVGPVSVGKNKFRFEAPAADFSMIPRQDILGVTIILLTCSYKGSEFIRVGYYVNNEYDGDLPVLPGQSPKVQKVETVEEEPAGEEAQKEDEKSEGEAYGITEKEEEARPNYDLSKIEVEKLRRNILSDQPRVTKFQIVWDEKAGATSENTSNTMAMDTS